MAWTLVWYGSVRTCTVVYLVCFFHFFFSFGGRLWWIFLLGSIYAFASWMGGRERERHEGNFCFSTSCLDSLAGSVIDEIRLFVYSDRGIAR